MRHLIIFPIIIAIVTVYTMYKLLELFINLVPEKDDDKLYYQLDIYEVKRYLLKYIKI